ncbi:KAP family P-loop NTPase fold protein [Leucobacter luti]|uniref:KAP family P-loop NTPase fold protein n=1 Tax=Leucobacter luti TaxID=340320 RepID=UPI002442BE32|nr:P-loop NTPase fold protein [Leucobacter luti]
MQNQRIHNALGILDVPAEDDRVGVKDHIGGLAKFVRQCETPMTIAVQGGWGTGKTSVMNMLAKDLARDEDIHVVNFNTWQYSQFDLGNQLATSLLLRIISGMPDTPSSEPKKVRLFKIAQGLALASAQVAAPMVTHLANTVIPGAGDSLRELASKVAQREQELEMSPVEAIERLRSEFADLVQVSGKRVLVFVDDLDRLEPERAVELMEAIKLFLDVPSCVFVLAIDFDVVKRGVMQKYGEDFSDRKARSFFEKIIQVPFQLPTHLYDTTELLQDGLERSQIRGADLQNYAALARESIGTNPRATKRLVNTFALLKQVRGDVSDREKDADAFATLCLQNAYPSIADYLNLKSREEQVGEDLPSDDDDDAEAAIPDNLRMETKAEEREWREEWLRATPFLKRLREFFTAPGGQGAFDEQRFRDATRLASVTSAGDAAEGPAGPASGSWDRTTDIGEMRLRLEGVTPDSFIDWGMRFHEALSGPIELVGQRGAAWTLNRTDRKTKRRVGSLHFGKQRMRFEIERFEGERNPEAVLKQLQVFKAAFIPEGDSTTRVIALRNETETQLPLSVQWKSDDPIDPEELAQFFLRVIR